MKDLTTAFSSSDDDMIENNSPIGRGVILKRRKCWITLNCAKSFQATGSGLFSCHLLPFPFKLFEQALDNSEERELYPVIY